MKTDSSFQKASSNSLPGIIRLIRWFVLHGVFTLLGFVTTSHAGTHVWSGAGANSNWSNAANWSSGGVPTSVEAAPVKLVFPSNATSFTSTLNISNLKIDVIEFNLNSSNNYVFPNAGISTTFTGAAGDNLRIIGLSGTVIWQPAVNLQATTRINVEGSGGALIDFQGILSGSGGITKQGAGSLHFSTGSAANTFLGTLRLEAGSTRLAKISGTPCFGGNLHIVSGSCTIGLSNQIPDTASILMEGGSLMTSPEPGVASVTETLGPLTMGGAAVIRATSPNIINLGSTVTRDGATGVSYMQADAPSGQISLGGVTRTFHVLNDRLRLFGNITNGSGTGGITKTGAGLMEIMDACSYSGPVSVQEGSLSIGNNQSLGTTAGGTTVLANGTLLLGVVSGANITLPAAETLAVSGTVRTNRTAEIPGPISLSGSPVFSAAFSYPLTLSGILSGSVTELKFGAPSSGGPVKLIGTAGNTYSGLASINAGAYLELGKSSGQAITGTIRFTQGIVTLLASQQIADSGSIFFPDLGSGTFIMNGFNETLGFAFGPGYAKILLGDGTLTLNGTSSVQLGGPGNLVNIGGSALGKIRKLGSGTWTLFATTAAEGNLAVLSVEAGKMDFQGGHWLGEIQCLSGTLTGSGSVGLIKGLGGNVFLSNFSSAGFSGQAIGTVSGKIDGDTAGVSFERMITSGPVNLTGQTLQVTSSGFTPATSTGYRIFVNNSIDPIQGTFVGLPEGATVMVNGRPFIISYKGGDGNDVVLYFQGQGTPGPQITKVVPRPDGFVEIHLKFRPNTSLRLEKSADLNPPWTQLGLISMNAQGEKVVTINQFGAPRNFFRLQFYTF